MIIIITPPEFIPNEEYIINKLFENGLHVLHLRKPQKTRNEYEDFIKKITPVYRSRIVIHDHFDLVEEYYLKGIHLKSEAIKQFHERENYRHVSVSCHSTEEIDRLPFATDYVFLSPIFDSISKSGYRAGFDLKELSCYLKNSDQRIIALGGVNADTILQCRDLGFSGMALLGYIWENPETAISRFLKIFPPTVLSIAGFDPSSGAGISADIKTFENCGVYGLGICSAITFQNQEEYTGTHWMSPSEITRQCDILLKKFSPEFVKIGLIENFDSLHEIVLYLKQKLPRVKIIWDPILKASAGFEFHCSEDQSKLTEILENLYLITPNAEELNTLFAISTKEYETTVKYLQEICKRQKINILWKGGHNPEKLSTDRLITDKSVHTYSVFRYEHGKHGTGCVLSAAVTSRLAQGYSLPEACREGQKYVSTFIRSNDTLLGIHRPLTVSSLSIDLAGLSLQYITDYKEGMSIPEQVEAICKGGVRWIQLRLKEASTEEFLKIGAEVKSICQKFKAIFLINDRVDIALQLDADGVHLGQTDMNPAEARKLLGYGKIIGATCNTFEEIQERFQEQVDYIGLGPYTYTTTKKKLSPVLGLEGYRLIMESCRKAGITLPVHAIGGITEEDIAPLLSTGISGIALSSLLKNSKNLTAKTQEIIEIIKSNKTWNH